MAYSSKELERFQSYEKVHLRGVKNDLAIHQKIEELNKKYRNKGYMLWFNVLAIAFFSYSHYFDITGLGDTIYIILLIVFTINVALIFLQKKQIRELIEFYKTQ